MLAVKGGAPVIAPRERRWPIAAEADRQALETALRGLQRGGHEIRSRFEARFAADCGVKHTFAVSNGTVSLELILRALGMPRGEASERLFGPLLLLGIVSSLIGSLISRIVTARQMGTGHAPAGLPLFLLGALGFLALLAVMAYVGLLIIRRKSILELIQEKQK